MQSPLSRILLRSSPSEDALPMMSHCQAESCWEEKFTKDPDPAKGLECPLGPPPAAVRPHHRSCLVTAGFP